MDHKLADVAWSKCAACHTRWLHYHYENEGISRSGRWARGPLGDEQITLANAADVLSKLDWYFAGGSYFDGEIHKRTGPLV